MSAVFRYKLRIIGAISVFFAGFAATCALLLDGDPGKAAVDGALSGLMVGLFEELYFHGRAGAWMRRLRPLFSVPIYAAVGVLFVIMTQHITALPFGQWERLGVLYAQYHIVIPMIFVGMAIGILTLRVIGFVGAKTLVDLLIGRYLRPTTERKVLLFLDMAGSTAAVEALGQKGANAYIGKFLFDVSRPVTEHGGQIYLFTGDGLIGMWDWNRALAGNTIIAAVDAIRAAVESERPVYEARFGRFPAFRIGIHGGDVVIGEQGDTKRAIGVYGDPINIAARLEQMAKDIGVQCIVSAAVADALPETVDLLEELAPATVRGIAGPVPIRSYPV